MSIVHDCVDLERRYQAPPTRVFHAFADPATKRRWFAEGEGWTVEHYALDFRIGGSETARFRFRGGSLITNETVIHDLVPAERIVSSYAMTIDGAPLSASLLTIEFAADGDGTFLRFVDHVAFLDGADDIESRTSGSEGLLEALAKELAQG